MIALRYSVNGRVAATESPGAVFGVLSAFALAGLLAAYPAQMLRLRLKGIPWVQAIFVVLAKLPEAQGALQYRIKRLRGKQSTLIEYK